MNDAGHDGAAAEAARRATARSPLLRLPRLESELKLDINRLARRGMIDPGGFMVSGFGWTNNCTGEVIASGPITGDMSGTNEGRLRIQIGQLDQQIGLVSRPRHFGGKQSYFICPHMKRCPSVPWKPPGARDFACRQRWRYQVA